MKPRQDATAGGRRGGGGARRNRDRAPTVRQLDVILKLETENACLRDTVVDLALEVAAVRERLPANVARAARTSGRPRRRT